MERYHTGPVRVAVRRLEEEGKLTDEIKQRLASVNFHVDYYFSPEGKIKRPMNQFLIYAQMRRAEIANDKLYEGFTAGEISKILKVEWDDGLYEAKKRHSREKAHTLKQVHGILFPDYIYTRKPNNHRKKEREARIKAQQSQVEQQEDDNSVLGVGGNYTYENGDDAPDFPDEAEIDDLRTEYHQLHNAMYRSVDENYGTLMLDPETAQAHGLATQPQVHQEDYMTSYNFNPFVPAPTFQPSVDFQGQHTTAFTTQPQIVNPEEDYMLKRTAPNSFYASIPESTPGPSIASFEPQQDHTVFPPPVTADPYSSDEWVGMFGSNPDFDYLLGIRRNYAYANGDDAPEFQDEAEIDDNLPTEYYQQDNAMYRSVSENYGTLTLYPETAQAHGLATQPQVHQYLEDNMTSYNFNPFEVPAPTFEPSVDFQGQHPTAFTTQSQIVNFEEDYMLRGTAPNNFYASIPESTPAPSFEPQQGHTVFPPPVTDPYSSDEWVGMFGSNPDFDYLLGIRRN